MAKLIVGVNDLATVNPELAKEWDYEKNEKKPQDYTSGSNQKVWWKCDKGHEWQVSIKARYRGSICPYCTNNKVLIGYNDLATTHPELVKEWNYEKNEKTPQDYLSGSNQKVWWICVNGHEWFAQPNSRVNGHGCPYCTGKYPVVGKTDLLTVNPELAKEWNYDKNKNDKPQMYLPNSMKKVWWLGKCGHEWQATINSRNYGNGCPYCSENKVLTEFNSLNTKYPSICAEWNYERNTKRPNEYTFKSSQKVWWKCDKGHEWQARIGSRTLGRGCPYCSGSKTERLSYQVLKELNIPFVAEKKFSQDMYISFYPYDIWIASKKLIIELDGIQHFQEIGYFEESKPFQERRKTDNLKNNYCLTKGIPILRIPYTYNPDTEKEKIKSMIKDFIETRKIPQEIIDFYEQYKENNNYAEIARKINKL